MESDLAMMDQKKTDEWEDKIKKQETFAHKTTVDLQKFSVDENIDEMVKETEQSVHEAEVAESK